MDNNGNGKLSNLTVLSVLFLLFMSKSERIIFHQVIIGIPIKGLFVKVNAKIHLWNKREDRMKIYLYNGKSNSSGERVRIARENEGITQNQLAARLQVEGIQLNQKAISRIETGVRVVADYELIYLAKALKVPPGWLLSGEENKT